MNGAPPYSLEAEESVVGGILVHGRRFSDVAAILAPEDFYHPALRAIYEAMLELDGDSKPIDALTVIEQMRSTETYEKLRALGSDEYLTTLMAKVVTVENIAYHAKLVHKKAECRRWMDTMRELVATGYQDGDADAWLVKAEQSLIALMSRSIGGEDLKGMKAVMHEFVDELEERWKRKKAGGKSIIGVSTGYERLDEITSGLRNGALYIVAGRPGSGKSALAMNVVENSARMNVAWLVFTLEMPAVEMGQRLVSANTRIDGQQLAQGEIDSAAMWVRITKAVGDLAGLPITFRDQGGINIAKIRSLARRWRMGEAAKYEHVGVCVDYMQLVDAVQQKGYRSREQDVSEISRGLKLLARDLGCPVIGLAQLNRELEKRADKRPMLSDLRESGALEQDADVVSFVYRDAMYHDRDTCNEGSACQRCSRHDIAEVIVAKQRNGPTGSIDMLWRGQFTRFESLSSRGEP